jgi:E3 ubiquitin-protein ligase Topors
MQRMIPWLSRELFAILRAPGISSIVLERVLDLLPNHEIHSRQFWSGVESYLRHHCDHFIHEFYNFARSPYDMIGFDENAVYSGRTNTPVCVIVISFICA